MEYKEYNSEKGRQVIIDRLKKSKKIPLDIYSAAHENLPIICHDVIIRYRGKALLVIRGNAPGAGTIWPVGGRVLRGVNLNESLKDKVKKECGLELENILLKKIARTYFKTDPFGHGKGTDTINFMFIANGKGKVKIDNFHKGIKLLDPLEFQRIKSSLHPYTRDYLEIFFKEKGVS